MDMQGGIPPEENLGARPWDHELLPRSELLQLGLQGPLSLVTTLSLRRGQLGTTPSELTHCPQRRLAVSTARICCVTVCDERV